MEKFVSHRIECLKIRFYSIIGRLELEKEIMISDLNLKIFEESLDSCQSEVEAAGVILGAIRRYEILLSQDHVAPEKMVPKNIPSACIVDAIENECDSGANDTVYAHDLTKEQAVLDENALNAENLLVELNQEVASNTEQLVVELNREELFEILNSNANDENTDENENTDEVENTSQVDLPLTNSVEHNLPYVDQTELNTTRENKSYFLIYSKIGEYNIGCEFTLRRKGKCPRYECKTCRHLQDKQKRSGTLTESAAAVTILNGNVIEVKKPTHHRQCKTEYSSTALARSAKNAAVVFRSKYGGTCKQVYDNHTKILSATNENLTAYDIAVGFQTYGCAQSALKKCNKRKTAINQPKVDVSDLNIVDKESTQIKKSNPGEQTDYFLIGQDEKAGVIVLGSKFMVEKFFRSKKAMSDGTFKTAPIGYKQSYMLWFVLEGTCKDEKLQRSKAMLAVTFLLKGKSEATYNVAFKILDEYRRDQNIPEPSFDEYITDDEPAVRNAIATQYDVTEFSLCLFHNNQNIVKCLTEHKLTNFIRKCKTDEQLWFYGKIKKILVIPLLPLTDIIPAFKELSASILSFIKSQFTNSYEVEQFQKYFTTIEERYFSNPEKIKMICKYGKQTKSTNLIESTHHVFNGSTIIPKHGTVANFIEGMKTIDLEYRALTIAYDEKGPSVFPKKKSRYEKQQVIITECTTDLDNKKITIDQFLDKCAEAMINSKYYKLVEAATERLENLQSSEEDDSEVDEHIMAIFATSESTHGRVRKLCSKYFGEEWLN